MFLGQGIPIDFQYGPPIASPDLEEMETIIKKKYFNHTQKFPRENKNKIVLSHQMLYIKMIKMYFFKVHNNQLKLAQNCQINRREYT